jgi:glucose dehydrogenase
LETSAVIAVILGVWLLSPLILQSLKRPSSRRLRPFLP